MGKELLWSPARNMEFKAGSESIDTGEIIFLGTGTSEGVPIVSCLTQGFESDDGGGEPCKVCFDAVRTDIRSPNRRQNTSLMIRYRLKQQQQQQQLQEEAPTTAANRRSHANVLIDCGKFFWASALEWFPRYQLRHIDALVLTHRHTDACYGLDDLRDWTRMKDAVSPLNVYLRAEDLEHLKQPFPYLVEPTTVSHTTW